VENAGLNTINVQKKTSPLDGIRVVKRRIDIKNHSSKEIELIEQYFRKVSNIEHEGIVSIIRVRLEPEYIQLIVEDFKGVPMSGEMGAVCKNDIKPFLQTGLRLSKILDALITHGVVHGRINPKNLLVDRVSGQIKLTGFNRHTPVGKKAQLEITTPEFVKDVLPYVSPEQTGRINRRVDYRTDFYSVGVILYELITGEKPFVSNDPMEIIHAHIAKIPVPAGEKNKNVSGPASDIIMKLLSKSPDDRYQSAKGLENDLRKCFEANRGAVRQEHFQVGQVDISRQLEIPDQLYGREREVEMLLQGFERIRSGKRQVTMVKGYSGIGKTRLIREIVDPVTRANGFFIEGKYDQFKQTVPYSAVVQAFQCLIRQILTEASEKIHAWKEKVLSVLETSGQVIIEVIPELEWIIGKQPPVPRLEALEAQNRFNKLFEKFTKVFTDKQNPLTIFIDDLQWADLSSLTLIETLISRTENHCFYFIGAFRENEVTETHPLMLFLDNVKKRKIRIDTLSIRALKSDDVKHLIAGTLGQGLKEASSLTELIREKTGGNPLFINRLLQTLYAEKLLKFDYISMSWFWDRKKIEAECITDNIVDLMTGQIEKLADKNQKLLQLAACIGNRFSLKLLSIISGEPIKETASCMEHLVEQGFVVAEADMLNRLKSLARGKQEIHAADVFLAFLHDRVQQAVYDLISYADRVEFDLMIGRLLLKNTPKEALEANIFDIVNPYNFGCGLIEDRAERHRLAELNLLAGNRARASSAFSRAYKYYRQGLRNLDGSSWKTRYNFTLSIHLCAAETAQLVNDYSEMDNLIEAILNNAESLLDKTGAYEIRIVAFLAQGKPKNALDTAFYLFSLLGEKFPEKPNRFHILFEVLKTKLAMIGKTPEDMLNLPEMTDQFKIAAMHLVTRVGSAVLYGMPELFPVMIIRAIRRYYRYGVADNAGVRAGSYAMILCGVFAQIDSGYRFGKVGFKLIDKFNAVEKKCMSIAIFYMFIDHWKNHLKESIQPLKSNYQTGIETGDFEYACYSLVVCSYKLLFVGTPLTGVKKAMAEYYSMILELGQESSLQKLIVFRQATLNLLGESKDPCILDGVAMQEKDVLKNSRMENDQLSFVYFYISKVMLCFLFENYQMAYSQSKIAKKHIKSSFGQVISAIYNFYDSLSTLAVCARSSKKKRRAYLKQVKKNQKKMKAWAMHAPMNYEHKYVLVEAEKANVLGQNEKAVSLYDQAAEIAMRNEYFQEAAIANECAGRFYLYAGRKQIASSYMEEACRLYKRWEAFAKVRQMKKKYPELLQAETLSSKAVNLDLDAVIHVFKDISSEISLPRLLEKIIKTVVETSGAEKALFLLHSGGRFFIQARYFSISDSIDVSGMEPVDESDDLDTALVNYVKRTRKDVILDNAAKSGSGMSSDYIRKNRPKSMLCIPVMNQGKLLAILYLENNLTANAFIPKITEMLKLICLQAAVSLENAMLYKNLERLYTNLEGLVKKRTLELTRTLENLKATQQQLVESEKIAVLGQLAAGIAHEINTPLGVIQASAGNMLNAFNEAVSQLPELFKRLSVKKVELFFSLVEKALEEKKSLSAREERKERKRLSLQLAKGGVAEPDALADTLVDMGVYESMEIFLPLLRGKNSSFCVQLAYNLAGQQRNSKSIFTAVERASKVVFAMKNYARFDHSGQKIMADITEGIDTVLTLYNTQLKQGVEVITRYRDHPLVPCFPDELNQVWNNLIYNAMQAMENAGVLEISTRLEGRYISASIVDSGPGIAEDIRERIFEPFFTTKAKGAGSGLGLDICKNIIEKHQGTIAVESKPGRTAFTVHLPV